jgi:pyruvate dehydrogenase phosphatase
MDDKLLREAVAATEQKFTHVVNDNKHTDPDIKYVGSCCLITLIWKGVLYIANLGDSRVVLGTTYTDLPFRQGLQAQQLTRDRNREDHHIRVGLQQIYPDDTILMPDDYGWRAKDLSKVCSFTLIIVVTNMGE